jgi:hypothetical protein
MYSYGYQNGYNNDKTERRTVNRQFQEAASLRKAANDTGYFWEMVDRNSRQGFKKQGVGMGSKQEEKMLFGRQPAGEGEVAEFGVIDDKIPVERSGPRSDEIAALDSFRELEAVVPEFVTQNIRLMNYDAPTPIQKHSIPLGLAGVDLMCCSQTVSQYFCHSYYISHTAYRILHIAYRILHIAYRILHTAYCILHTAYCILHTAYCILHTAYCILHTSYFISHIAYSSPHTSNIRFSPYPPTHPPSHPPIHPSTDPPIHRSTHPFHPPPIT